MGTIERTVDIVKEELKIAMEESNKHFQNAPKDMDWREFENYMSRPNEKVSRLSREHRMLLEPIFEEIPSYGDVMSLSDFIENCEDGGFIDYDGSGNYIKDGKMSQISIHPSDVKHNSVRSDFDVVWAGLYIDTDNRGNPIDVFWRPGFHGSDRQLIFPVRLTHVNKVKRMETTFNDTRKIMELEIPNGLRTEVLKNKEKQQLYLERQMIAQMLPGGDAFAKETIKAEKIQKTIDEQKELNTKLKNIAKEEREAKESGLDSK